MDLDDNQSILVMPGLFGAPVHIHVSLVFLLLFFLTMGGAASPEAFGGVMVFVTLVLLAILLHEWGHAWGAYIQGIKVEKVVLYGGGGLCYSGPSSTTEREFIVAMGPIVNLALWAISSLLADHIFGMDMASRSTQHMIVQHLDLFASINLFLFIFNMLPMQPLDGGKLLNLVLLRVLQPARADRVTGMIGLAMCLLYLPLMAWVYFTLGFVLLFLPSFRIHRDMAAGRPTY